MAKVVGLIGSASGKVGNVVYAVTNGIQVARVYQPVVSNPKSQAQMLQRAKCNLVARLSTITPKGALLGLGNSGRSRRAEFLHNCMVNATAQLTDGTYVAKLNPSALVFSKGATTPVINISAAALSANGILTITYNRIIQVSQDEWTGAGGTFIAVAVDSVTGNYDFVRTKQWNKPAYPATADTSFTETMSIDVIDAHEVFVYFVPWSIDSQKLSTITNGLGVDTNEFVASLDLTSSANLVAFGHSKYIGMATSA